ncbi:MAG TPA: hypothetical protein P5248_11095 [Bacteroidales bacterium]|nr:hypothetical protein [Bacteroidales bacterium]
MAPAAQAGVRPGEGGRRTVKVMPHPVRGQAIIEVQALQAGTYHFRLLNMQGDEVLVFSIPVMQPGTYFQAVDLGELPKGPYLLIEHDGSRRESSSVIIVGP